MIPLIVGVVCSVNCAAWKNKRNWNFWTSERTEQCHVGLMLGSYVSGAGHFYRAQKKAATQGIFVSCVPDMAPFMTIHPENIATMQEYLSTIRRYEKEME